MPHKRKKRGIFLIVHFSQQANVGKASPHPTLATILILIVKIRTTPVF